MEVGIGDATNENGSLECFVKQFPDDQSHRGGDRAKPTYKVWRSEPR